MQVWQLSSSLPLRACLAKPVCEEANNKIPKGSSISIDKSMQSIWSLHGYFSRYGNYSLVHSKDDLTYGLVDKTMNIETTNYKTVLLENDRFILFER